MTDVPEHTWALATILHHAGVEFLHIGCNGMSAPLDIPPLSWWEGPDGSRTLLMYSRNYGTGLVPEKGWPYRTWLALLHTGDNHGPPRPEEVRKVLDDAARALPGVKVRIGRLSDFADAIRAEQPDLPVIRGDAPDTWIHGPMSDPEGAAIARTTRPLIAAAEALNTQLRARGVDVPDASATMASAYEQSLLYGEHTWGGSIGWIQNRLSFGAEFQKDRAAGRFRRIEESWDEHSNYIKTARALVTPLLTRDLQALASAVHISGKRIVVYNPLPWVRDGLVSASWDGAAPAGVRPADGGDVQPVERSGALVRFVARGVPPMGYRAFVPVDSAPDAQPLAAEVSRHMIEGPFFRVALDPSRGAVSSLIDKRDGRELADDAGAYRLGQYLYERFDADQVQAYCKAYNRPGQKLHPDFFKPGQPPASDVPYRAASPADFTLRLEPSPVSVAAVMESRATAELPAVTTRVVIYRDLPYADLEITLHDKPLEPWPEAGWLCLPFRVTEPRFRLGRLGSIIDPTRDLLPSSNRHIFGLNTGATLADASGSGVGLCPLDGPLVSLHTPGCWKFSSDFMPKAPVVFVNLFNNQWDTNFRLWNAGTWTARVRLWSVAREDDASSLITPSLEARYPLLAASAEGEAGSLPPRERGVELSRKGVLITAFGPNPDGAGTILRLWELAGQGSSCRVLLPGGMGAASIQPVNLRGCAEGPATTAQDGSLSVEMKPFAPISLVIGTP
jgi:hypothetical protein